jgi:hypothetical protein
MATYAGFIARVRRELEESSMAVWDSSSLLDWCNDAIFDLERKLRSSIDEQYRNTVVSQAPYLLPTNTLEVISVYYDTSKLQRVTPAVYYDLKVHHTTDGTPCAYALIDGYVYLSPAPSEVKELKFMRVYRQSAIASTSSVADMPWESKYNDLLSYYIKARAYEQIPDFDQVTMNDNMYQRGAANAMLNELQDYTGDYYMEPECIW